MLSLASPKGLVSNLNNIKRCQTGRKFVKSKVSPDLLSQDVVLNEDVYIQIIYYFIYTSAKPASVAQLDAPSNWRPGGRRFNPRRGRQHSFVEIDHEIFSTFILSLPLIQ